MRGRKGKERDVEGLMWKEMLGLGERVDPPLGSMAARVCKLLIAVQRSTPEAFCGIQSHHRRESLELRSRFLEGVLSFVPLAASGVCLRLDGTGGLELARASRPAA